MTQATQSDSTSQPVRLQVLSEDKCAEIVDSTFRILDEMGCDVHNEEALGLLRDAGCSVDGHRVRIPPDVMKAAIDSAPSEFTLYNRNGEPAIHLGPGEIYFGPNLCCTHTIDLETHKKRPVLKADAVNTALVCDALPNIDWASGICMVSDCDQRLSEVHEAHAVLQNTTKPILSWANSMDNIQDILEMFEVVAGSPERLVEKPFVLMGWCPVGGFKHGDVQTGQFLYMVERNLPAMYVPGYMLGSQAPVTIAGCIVVSLADTLVGLLLSQLKRRGARFLSTCWVDGANMSSGLMTATAPEISAASAAVADIFRYLKLPFASHLGFTDSPIFDQQAATDLTLQLYTGAICGGNMNTFIGFMESAMTSCLESLAFGDEVISQLKYIVKGVEVSNETLAEETIRKVGPGGTYLGQRHTAKHVRELWRPTSFIRESRNKWEDKGSKDLLARLNERVREIVAKGPKSPLENDIINKLDAIVERAEKRITKEK
jgi:trimethylamine---corrinoid protein Co-methyltransferase